MAIKHGRVAFALVAAGVLFAGPAAVATQADTSPTTQSQPADRQGKSVQPERTSPAAYAFGETLAKLDGKALEVTFLAEIISHHQGAIEMAKLELERGTDPDIRTHAENIISSQQNQVRQFTRWLKEWYGLTPEQARRQAPREAQQEMAALEKQMRADLARLKQVPAGEPFDVAFVRMIIPHHSAGIIEFLEPQSRAPHAQLRVAAATGIVTQEAEIADFRTWLDGQAK